MLELHKSSCSSDCPHLEKCGVEKEEYVGFWVLIWHFESCSNVTNNRTGKKNHSESLRKSLLTKLQARSRTLLQIMLV